MALMPLSVKRPSGFLEVPPSPPQSPPVVDAEFSPPSPAASSDSPIDGFLRLPLAPSGPFHGVPPERAKKRRKQERPSLFVVDQSVDEEEDLAAQSKHIETPPSCVWNGMAVPAAEGVDASMPEQPPPPPPPAEGCESVSQESDQSEPEGLPTSELHPSTAVVKPLQAELSTPLQSSTSLSSVFQQQLPAPGVLPSGYPSSPALARVGSGAAGSDGEGEGSDGGVQETCPECRKVFKRRVYLQRHMAREHWSTAKVFKCDKCAYETKHQSNLLVHRRTHTGSLSANYYYLLFIVFSSN